MEEARNGEGGNSSFAKEKSSRGEFERPQITGRGCWTVEGGFAGRWKRATGVCGGGRNEEEGGRNSGNAAITGVVEGEEHRWRQEAAGFEGRGRACGRLQTRGATCFMTSVHHIAPVS